MYCQQTLMPMELMVLTLVMFWYTFRAVYDCLLFALYITIAPGANNSNYAQR